MTSSSTNEMVLKCQFEDGQRKIVKGLHPTSLVKDLKDKIFSITDVPHFSQKILCGFPPKEIILTNDNACLSSIGIKTGDTLIVVNDSLLSKSYLRTESGDSTKLTRRVVPADNSCLFASISYIIHGNTSHSAELRQLVVKELSNDILTYNEAFLGATNKAYCEMISDPDKWGGGIEISILSKVYQIEIAVVNTESARIDRFGENENYTQRMFLIYDGIHYDPLEFITVDSSPRTLFDMKDNWIAAALHVGEEEHKMKKFTNLNKFQLRCLVCRLLLIGQTAARQHAKETGHNNFGEC